MRTAREFSNRTTNWDVTSTNIKPHLADMPQVAPLQAELESLIPDARALDSRLEVVRGQARDLTKQRQDLEKRGESLRRRIASHLRGTYGFTSEQLIQFGVNPRPRVRRKKAVATPPSSTPALAAK